MSTILITGAMGLIGGRLAQKIVSSGLSDYVICFDNYSTGKKQNLPSGNYPNWKFIKGDVNNYKDISAVFFANKIDYVFHYAAVVGVQRTLAHPMSVMNDIEGIKNVLDLSKSTGVKRVFFSSSSEVYGESVEFPQNEETTPINSKLPYAVVKNVGESFLRAYKEEHDLNYTIFRFFNTYGKGQSTDFVIPNFINNALKGTDIYVRGDGSQTRTFCYIDDNIDATMNAMNKSLFWNDVVNIGSNIEISILELAHLIVRLTNSKSRICNLPPLEEGDMKRRCPDVTKMNKLLDREFTSLKTGILKMINNGND